MSPRNWKYQTWLWDEGLADSVMQSWYALSMLLSFSTCFCKTFLPTNIKPLLFFQLDSLLTIHVLSHWSGFTMPFHTVQAMTPHCCTETQAALHCVPLSLILSPWLCMQKIFSPHDVMNSVSGYYLIIIMDFSIIGLNHPASKFLGAAVWRMEGWELSSLGDNGWWIQSVD